VPASGAQVMDGITMPSGTSSRTDVLISYRFYVEIDGITEAIFQEVSGLDIETEVTDYQEGGRNDHVHRLPGRTKVADITLKNGITTSMELWNWYKQVIQGPPFQRRHVSIIMVDQKSNRTQAWEFQEALPVKWTGPQLNAGQSVAAVQTLKLTHKGLLLR
jgi:phage tail-like protein